MWHSACKNLMMNVKISKYITYPLNKKIYFCVSSSALNNSFHTQKEEEKTFVFKAKISLKEQNVKRFLSTTVTKGKMLLIIVG